MQTSSNTHRQSPNLTMWLASTALLFFLIWVAGCGEETPTAPEASVTISDVTVSVANDTATIQWSTDVPADSQVEHGLTTDYGTVATSTALTTQHRVEVTGLRLQSTYYFRARSADESGLEAQSRELRFATLSEDVNAPKPSRIEASADIGDATIVWQSNESAIAEVEYGETSAYGAITRTTKPGLTHRVSFADLEPDTTYYYRIKLTDLDGNVSTSPDFTFQTKAEEVPAGENVVRVTVTARQWDFAPATIRASEGDKVILTLRSTDVPHGFGLAAVGLNEAVNPGGDVVVEFDARKKGSYPFLCTVQCGASHGNMRGTLIVE